jgi:drug/metabolite transporter (DMT)-like permease
MVAYLFPVAGVILGILFLKEPFDVRVILAGVMILGGVIMVNQPETKVQV